MKSLYKLWLVVFAWLILVLVPVTIFLLAGLILGIVNHGLGLTLSAGLLHPSLAGLIMAAIAMLASFVVFPIWVITWIGNDAAEFKKDGIKTSPSAWVLVIVLPPIVLGILLTALSSGPAIFMLSSIILAIIAWLFVDLAIVFPIYLIYRNIVWQEELAYGPYSFKERKK